MESLREWLIALGALGTVGAFGATSWLLRIEVYRRRSEDEARERSQAALVTWWVGKHIADCVFEVHLRNSSDGPVYGVLLVRRKFHKLVINTIPPQETIVVSYDFEVGNPGSAIYEHPHLFLHFMDANERAWRRGVWGRLERLSTVDPLPEELPD